MILTSETFVGLVEAMSKQADEFIRADGFVQETIVALHPAEGVRLQVLAVDVSPSAKVPDRVVVVPPPLQNHEVALRELFAKEGVQAAIWRGEAWVFPESDPDAGTRYLAGEGPSPSQHPNRQEIVITAGFWPLRGVAVAETSRIVRTAAGDYTRPLDSHSFTATTAVSEDSPHLLTMLTSWLEHTLPQPDDPPSSTSSR